MLHPWQTTASRYVIQDQWIRLRADTCVRHDGLVIDPYYVLEKRDFVHVIPVLCDGRIALVRQYRHGAQHFSLELPGGVLDHGETPETGAKRELLEECGITGGTWSRIAHFHPNCARQNNYFHCYFARDVSQTTAPSFDQNEELELHFLTVAEIDAAIADGSYSQGSHIAAFLLARHLLV